MIVLDAGVLIAVLESEDVHHEWARRLIAATASEVLVVSALTLAEALVHPAGSRRGRQAEEALHSLGLDVRELGSADALPLAEIRATSRLRMPDATVLYTALRAGADVATTDRGLARAAIERGVAAHWPGE